MEFHLKLKACRLANDWTQEQLAEKVFVSRVTVSKWETGRGLPNLGSLQQLATLFGVSVDELLSTKELVSMAQAEVQQGVHQGCTLMFGILDVLVMLLLVLPVFNDRVATSVSLIAFSPVTSFLQPLFMSVVLVVALLGVVELALQQKLKSKTHASSFCCSLLMLILFLVSRQPYPSLYVLFLMIGKGYFLLKRR